MRFGNDNDGWIDAICKHKHDRMVNNMGHPLTWPPYSYDRARGEETPSHTLRARGEQQDRSRGAKKYD